MCGINGIYGLTDLEQSKAVIAKMNNALAHRGPDDEGVYVDNDIALGHRRLSIIDLSTAGHQPFLSHDKRYTIVYNGELYNYKEVKSKITDYPFATNTDTEVLLAAYIKWGKDCLSHFNGMFAFAIWDNIKKTLFIARDRIGIKPLYYYKKENQFVFSSEIRALLASELVPKKLNENSLVDYLKYQTVHAPNTIIKDVFMLMPGHFMEVESVFFNVKSYWNIADNIDTNSVGKSYSEICKDVHRLLFEAVERRLIADVPFGAFLSGGIDSSAIVGLMSKVSTKQVKTFFINFKEEEYSEAKYAKLIAQKFNTDHHEITVSVDDLKAQLPAALKAMDHPSGDGPNTYLVSKLTKEAGITMVLSGLGGDELFCGYDIFKRSYALNQKQWLANIPLFLRNLSGTVLKSIKPGISSEKIAELLKQNSFDLSSTYPLSRQVLLDEQVQNILNLKLQIANSPIINLNTQYSVLNTQYSILSSVSIAEITTYMQNVLLRDTDQMSMAHALEVRVPFLDYKLVEYVLGVRDQNKYPTTPKKLLIDSLNGLLPNEIIDRPKMGFTFPWKYWMKNELKSFCESKLTSLSARSYFKAERVMNLWKAFLKDDPKITWSRIWHLVVLENWLSENNIE